MGDVSQMKSVILIVLSFATVFNLLSYIIFYVNPVVHTVQGIIFLLLLGYNFYVIQRQIIPRSLYLTLAIALLGMFSILFISVVLLLLAMTAFGDQNTILQTNSAISAGGQCFFLEFYS